MTKNGNRDRAWPVAASLGWHVHYEDGGRLRVQLAFDRETAIELAQKIIRRNQRVLRLVRHDGREIIGAEDIQELCAGRTVPVRGTEV